MNRLSLPLPLLPFSFLIPVVGALMLASLSQVGVTLMAYTLRT